MSGSTSLSAQDQAFLTADTQNKLGEILIDQLATSQAGSVADAELGRWFGVDYTRLVTQNQIAAAATGATVPSGTSSTLLAAASSLGTLSGTAFDTAYQAQLVALKQADIGLTQTEASAGSNAVIKQLAASSQGLVTYHLSYTQAIQSVQAGNAALAIQPIQAIAGPAPAANGPLNAQDQTFVTNVTQGGLTAVQEGQLAQSSAANLSVSEFGVWNQGENSEVGSNIAALATAEGVTPPTTTTSAQANQVTALQSLTGGPGFDLAYARDQVSNDTALVANVQAEIAGGSDPAMVALGKLILAPAQALLDQAVIETLVVGTGLSDTAAAPNTLAGGLISAIGSQVSTGAITLSAVVGGISTVTSGTAGALLVDAANTTVSVPAAYSYVADIAGAPVTVAGAASTPETVIGGNGLTYLPAASANDLVVLTGGNNVVAGLATGAGNVTVVGSAGNNQIYAGSGADLIAAGTGNNTIGLGSGSDFVTSTGNDTILAGTGTDVVYGAGTTTAVFGNTGSLFFVGGAGIATVVVGNTPAVLFGGAAGTINLFGAASGDVLVAGGGNETLQGANATGGNVFFGGSGNDALIGGAGNDTFVAGRGSEVLAGGAGTNLFEFVSGGTGGGTDYITDFGSSSANRLTLIGYGGASPSTAAANALRSESVAGGNTTLTLTDNTKVVLVGVSNLSASSFI